MIRRYWWVGVIMILGVGWWLGMAKETKKPTGYKNVLETVTSKPVVTIGPTIAPVAEDIFLVVNWQAVAGSLQIGQLGGNKIVNIGAEVPKIRVEIPVSRQGVVYSQQVMQKENNEWYRLAFCGGDRLEIAGLGKDWEKLANGQKVEVERIRNLGPRKCVN